MDNQKIENLLNLSLNATPEEREKSPDLSAGYNSAQNLWTLIVKYQKNLDVLQKYPITYIQLLGNYAILEVPEELIDEIASLEEIIYVEKPKNLFYGITEGRQASCVSAVQQQTSGTGSLQLFGRGCIVGIIDSGIDYANPVFRNQDGTTRILGIWDQTIIGTPPEGYTMGTYYDRSAIQEALQFTNPVLQQEIVPSIDFSGHGTAVASIAAGNFSEDRNLNLGMATQSDIIAVKLGQPSANSFPRTSELMQAINFIVEKCISLNRPLALNLSFGNNYGSHTGTSLLETFINEAASASQNSIIIGMGNEGVSGSHTSGKLAENITDVIELSVSSYEPSLNIQIWKGYYDTMEVRIVSPQGNSFVIPSFGPAVYRAHLNNTELLIFYGEPNPYSQYQELYIDFIPTFSYLDAGLWRIELTGKNIVNGEYHLWIPVESSLNGSRFVKSTVYGTLTIPSTASRAISVAAYNPLNSSYAAFSGRGYPNESLLSSILKPDLAAPGVDITTAVPGGSFTQNSGTSMAAPFVTGAAAMMMQWGIIDRNDSFLYGEKLKAYLLKGARPLPGFSSFPSPEVGWGALCVSDSLPNAKMQL